MIRNCIKCGKEFEQPARRGRPLGFCDDECRGKASRDRTRLCQNVTCGKKFTTGDTPWPYHCSDQCHDQQTTFCMNGCGDPVKTGDRFCSTTCLQEHYGPSYCKRDQKLIVPNPNNLRTMPRYCSDECRYENREATPWEMDQIVRLNGLLNEMLKPLRTLPFGRHWYEPILIPYPSAPTLPRTTAHVGNSIVWWNHYLTDPDIPKDQLYITELGLKGWGSPSEHSSCLPLWQCWPWITTTARRQVPDLQAMFATWKRAGRAHNKTLQQMDSFRQNLETNISIATRGDENKKGPKPGYFNIEQNAPWIPTQYEKDLLKYVEERAFPAEAKYLGPKDLKKLAEDEFWAHRDTYEQVRLNMEYPQAWADDRPIADRTDQAINKALDEFYQRAEETKAAQAAKDAEYEAEQAEQLDALVAEIRPNRKTGK